MRAIKLPNLDFLSQRRKALVLSGIIMVASLLSLAIVGLNRGLDFTGGTLIEISYKAPVDLADVRSALSEGGFGNVMVQQFGTTRDVLLRIPPGRRGERCRAEPARAERSERGGGGSGRGPSGRVRRAAGRQELVEQSGLAVIFSIMGILAYVALRFEWRFSVGAVAATVHDAILILGVFSLFQIDFDLNVLAAVLTVIGYSLNDTIVVFDRVRENFRKNRKGTALEIMNQSVNETMSRTIITAGTVLLVVVALYLFGGETLRGFSLALIIGVVSGTYSTIYIASATAIMLGVSRGDLVRPPKEGAGADSRP